MGVGSTTNAAFFEQKYRRDPDPWHFATSDYEQGRYEATCRALLGRRYARAFEPGCSIGLLTERLAAICERVDAIDISPSAVKQAVERCRHLPNVNVHCGALPDAIPKGKFDLIVLSEIGYYFPEDELVRLSTRLMGCLEAGGTLLAVHWLGVSEDHLLSGDRVHEILAAQPGLSLTRAERHPGFRLDRWERE